MPEVEATDLKVLRGFLILTIFTCFTLFCIELLYAKVDSGPYLSIGFLNIFLLVLLDYIKSKHVVGNLYLGIWAIVLVNMSFQSGGIYSMDTYSAAIIPVAAIALIDHKSGIAWLVFYIAFIWYMWSIIETPEIAAYYRDQTLQFEKLYYLVGGLMLTTFTSGVISIFYFQNRKLIAKLKAKEIALNNHVSQLNEQSILLQKTQKYLKRSNTELEEYAHVASHDLMQPLRTVNSFAQLLDKHLTAREVHDQRSTEMLQFIVAGSNKMQTLITDLLDYAKHKKHGALKYSKVDLGGVILSVQADLKKQIDSNQVTIEVNVLPELFIVCLLYTSPSPRD